VSEFYVCLICHAEVGEPRDTPGVSAETVYEEWVPRLTELLDQVGEDVGARIPVTWCCGAYHDSEAVESGKVLCAEHFPDQWHALRDRGDEIGLHSHGPEIEGDETGFAGCWLQDLVVGEDVERMVELGFDPPKTYVPGMFVWRDELAGVLIKAGFEASSSVIALPGKYLAWVELFDYLSIPIDQCLLSTHQPFSHPFRPYRASRSRMAERGESELVELPVIGYVGKWDHEDFENSPPYDLVVDPRELTPRNWIADRYLVYEHDTRQPFPNLRQRWETREDVGVDVWPTFFHPFEMDEHRLARTERFLREVASWEDVRFATVLDAVRAWKRSSWPGEREQAQQNLESSER
jgi:hypothetical protein